MSVYWRANSKSGQHPHSEASLSAANMCQRFTRQHVKYCSSLPSVESPTGLNATLTSSPMSHSGVTGATKQVQTACHSDLAAGCANLSVRALITETFNCHNIAGRRAADTRWDEATTRFKSSVSPTGSVTRAKVKWKKSEGTSISLFCGSIWLQFERKGVDPKLPSNPTFCKYPTGPLAKLLHFAVGRQSLQFSIAFDLLDLFKKSFHCILAKYVCSCTSGTSYHHSHSTALPLSVHNEIVEKVKCLGTIIDHKLTTSQNTNNVSFLFCKLQVHQTTSNPFSQSISFLYHHLYQQ